MTAMPSLLPVNRGDGTFVDRTADSGISDVGNTLALGDFDLDGSIPSFAVIDSDLTLLAVDDGDVLQNLESYLSN